MAASAVSVLVEADSAIRASLLVVSELATRLSAPASAESALVAAFRLARRRWRPIRLSSAPAALIRWPGQHSPRPRAWVSGYPASVARRASAAPALGQRRGEHLLAAAPSLRLVFRQRNKFSKPCRRKE